MDTSKQNDKALHVRAGEDDSRQFVFHPDDYDLFVRTGRQVIEACQLGISVELWLHECGAMLQCVRDWAEVRTGRVAACYAVPRGPSVVLFVVPQGERFDFDLADEMAELNRELVRGFNVGMIEMQQVPESEIDRFVAPGTSRTVYPHVERPHQPVET